MPYLLETNSLMLRIAVNALASIPRSTLQEVADLAGLIESDDLQGRLSLAKFAWQVYLIEKYVGLNGTFPPVTIADLYPMTSGMADIVKYVYQQIFDIDYIIANAATLEAEETLVTYLDNAQNGVNFLLGADFQIAPPTPPTP